ncbi:(deoxy)nucleoside triphosphate pyrophosphohydrolase [Vagococcus intermedius]|uniref:8-oxo-dGTP diphosphatase n=1 Tax=Vagococcus intermedius TaxID=2991418 RepID=A0AAF0I7K3_9ENTE|nr:(deoxy)nucleoside triphosphate pyrophosphohydrolase [Vagococcus intermedius]WEG73081.1 (deoxy)nucleoside triphosphate pyrophosphohydrolase [Vagococcus intermedius]WEG75165.1 (deoxy)nucleoside triphosphate pyrophosphohydrolase [Vagococcus intermedius]
MTSQINVVGAIIIKDNKILCAQRGLERDLAYLWEFPGGKVEQNESPREALERELVEELELKIIVSQNEFETTSYLYPFGCVHLTTYLCYLESDLEPVLKEHIAVRWLEADELLSLRWAPADVPSVKKIISQDSLEH